jgi:hypothetical protein
MKNKMLQLVALAAAVFTMLSAPPAFSQAPPPPVPSIPPNLQANDNARFLAGLPPSPGSPLAEIAKEKAWQDHAKFFDAAWEVLENTQLSKIRAWDAAYIPDASAGKAPVFYMFSGPDYLYVNAFFPGASTYVLCGIEPVGELPDVTKLRPGTLAAELRNLQTSLNSVMAFSFFITKDMKVDLVNHELSGTLPIIYIFLARSGKTINDASLVGLDTNGALEAVGSAATVRKGLTPGIKITFSAPNAAEPQTLYYFSTDISDDGIKKSGFLKFCRSLGPGSSFVKSASYLMHESYFSTIRSFLLDRSTTLVQDDSGIPLKYFASQKWNLRLFGSYPGPIEIFKKYDQLDLAALYKSSNPPPLEFGIGYRHHARESALIVATPKTQPAAEAPAAPTPAQ